MPVWQIAFETSSRQASVALLRQDIAIMRIPLDAQIRTAQSIGPAVQSLLLRLREEQAELGLVSVAVGPGSFTGLRIGVTAAKTLAFARNCPVVSCDTLAVIASQVRRFALKESELATGAVEIDVAINAYRGQVFHRRESMDGVVLIESRAVDQAEWLVSLGETSDGGKKVLVAGDVWKAETSTSIGARNLVDARISVEASNFVELASPDCWQPMADEVGRLAWGQFSRGDAAGGGEDCLTVKPKYLRESAAIEKLANRI